MKSIAASSKNQNLPKELTRLVDWSVRLLGQQIRGQLGTSKFRRIERIRVLVKSPKGQSLVGLQALQKELAKLSGDEQWEIGHAFALMLELINTCESAYRCHRLRQTTSPETAPFIEGGKLTHVLTAHPTESRDPLFLSVILRIQDLLARELLESREHHAVLLLSELRLLWQCSLAKQKKPSVEDEADYIFSLALNENILTTLVSYSRSNRPFYLRTWVGGDKDGHPGVNEKTLLASLQKSRVKILQWVHHRLEEHREAVHLLLHSRRLADADRQRLLNSCTEIFDNAKDLKKVDVGDAKRVSRFIESLQKADTLFNKVIKGPSQSLQQIRDLLFLFPSLVMPLELREDSTLVHEATGPKKNAAIVKMLRAVRDIAKGGDVKGYVRGFVISRTESDEDILTAMSLARRELGNDRLPIIPLFESASALESAQSILRKTLRSPAIRQRMKKNWGGKFEVMLGYSDSAKENGVFSSKFLIDQSLRELDPLIRQRGLRPVFFHGSGGSVERGGGSVEEQTEWWPASVFQNVKMTIQGEMIYRTYSQPEILRSQIQQLSFVKSHAHRKQRTESEAQLLKKLATEMQTSYRTFVASPDFLNLVAKATPYPFLQNLKMGSRPSKRSTTFSLGSLRAIPWVLCWTQTRLLMPTWIGVGTFWAKTSKKEKLAYKKLFKNDSLFRSYVKVLGFTLAKVELPIFFFYLENSDLPRQQIESYKKFLKSEKVRAEKFVRSLSGKRDLLWHRPWLGKSIALRSPLISPLNVLQTLALKNRNIPLLRESVSGVASGMLTTG